MKAETEMCECETCGEPTRMTGTKRCDGCWEVEHRLARYLCLGPKAVAFVDAALQAHKLGRHFVGTMKF
jgi:hypothetical protein